MRKSMWILYCLVACLGASVGAAEAYTPAPWNLEARAAFARQRFGIFVHWGAYSELGKGEWFLQVCKLDEPTYAGKAKAFNPTKFDAKKWIGLFKDAGAKYLTITSRHHDGFAIWPSKVDDYNIGSTPLKRDPLGELAAACRDEGLQLNFYYSLMDWHRADYPAGYKTNRLHPERAGDYPSYKRYMMGQISELIDNYRPGVIWFDGEWDHMDWKYGILPETLDWELDDIYDLIHAKKTLVANNHHRAIRPKEDIQLFERDLPGDKKNALFSRNQAVAQDRPLEQCDMLQTGGWGYNAADRTVRPAADVVALVARAAAKGSNLLLNVAPDGTGEIPPEAVAVLKEVGAWFRKNGESIYGTEACDLAEGNDVVATRRGNTVYLHFLNPEVATFAFQAKGSITRATCLATGEHVMLTNASSGKTIVRAPRAAGDRFDVVVKLDITVPVQYLVVDLAGGKDARHYPVSWLTEADVPKGGWTDEYKTTKLVLRKLPARQWQSPPGTFWMGSPKTEEGRAPTKLGEEDLHDVTLTKDFWIGVFEVTQKQLELVTGERRGFQRGDTHPVEDFSWQDVRGSVPAARNWPNGTDVGANSFIGRLRARTGLHFDLPTEAEWEYACRAGTRTAYSWGNAFDPTKACAATDAHRPVGSYAPNAWGLYDLHGNVAEWCLDWYQWSCGTNAVTDPKGAPNGTARVLRGGSWRSPPKFCRSASRGFDAPSYGSGDDGFRLVCFQGWETWGGGVGGTGENRTPNLRFRKPSLCPVELRSQKKRGYYTKKPRIRA